MGRCLRRIILLALHSSGRILAMLLVASTVWAAAPAGTDRSCPRCRRIFRKKGLKFCPHDGLRLVERRDETRCSACGKVWKPTARFCPYCGRSRPVEIESNSISAYSPMAEPVEASDDGGPPPTLALPPPGDPIVTGDEKASRPEVMPTIESKLVFTDEPVSIVIRFTLTKPKRAYMRKVVAHLLAKTEGREDRRKLSPKLVGSSARQRSYALRLRLVPGRYDLQVLPYIGKKALWFRPPPPQKVLWADLDIVKAGEFPLAQPRRALTFKR